MIPPLPTTRLHLPDFLTQRALTHLGIELGVASGAYSEHLLMNMPLRRLYSVDMWAGDRGHGMKQCDAATRRLSKYGARSIVLRARFDEALALFDDHALDFAYIDGYAHTGNADGRTLHDWWEKVKPGGVLAGHDYDHENWPKNVAAVDAFRAEKEGGIAEFFTTGEKECASWVVVKGDSLRNGS